MHVDSQPVFRALADPTRRAILEKIAERPLSIGEIADGFDMTRPAIAKHLKILEEGALIVVTPKGRERINSLNAAALRSAAEWIAYFDRFWDERLDALKTLVETTK